MRRWTFAACAGVPGIANALKLEFRGSQLLCTYPPAWQKFLRGRAPLAIAGLVLFFLTWRDAAVGTAADLKRLHCSIVAALCEHMGCSFCALLR